jgi:group I intron endonuclease
MKSGIYKITNNINGKFYIGSSENIDNRWNNHKQYLNGGYHINPKLQNAWKFYGGDKFQFDIIEETSSEKTILLSREQYYLDLFKPYMRDIGYNICPTANGGDNITYNPNRDAFIEKMSGISSGENNPMFGKKHSEESKQLQKEKSKGRFTLEWFIEKYGIENGQKKYEKRRQSLKNRKINYSYPNSNINKVFGPMSDEIKLKCVDSKKRMKTIKPFLILDIKSGLYTILQLSEKYSLSLFTIKYYKRKLKKDGLL